MNWLFGLIDWIENLIPPLRRRKEAETQAWADYAVALFEARLSAFDIPDEIKAEIRQSYYEGITR